MRVRRKGASACVAGASRESGRMQMKTHETPADVCPYAAAAVTCALSEANQPDAALLAHLAGCPACRHEAGAARALAVRLRAVPEAEPSPDLAVRILEALPSARRRRFTLLRPLAAAAAAALFAGALWFAADQSGRAASADVGRWLTQMQHVDGFWRTGGGI